MVVVVVVVFGFYVVYVGFYFGLFFNFIWDFLFCSCGFGDLVLGGG